MNDLLQKLEAAIAETERIAREAGGGEWVHMDLGRHPTSIWDETHRRPVAGMATAPPAGEHIAHNDPKRVLRRVARDRKLLERHSPGPKVQRGVARQEVQQCEYCASLCHSRSGLMCDEPADAVWPCDDVRDLAEDYEIEVGDRG